MKLLKRLLAIIGMFLMCPFGYLILTILIGGGRAFNIWEYLTELTD